MNSMPRARKTLSSSVSFKRRPAIHPAFGQEVSDFVLDRTPRHEAAFLKLGPSRRGEIGETGIDLWPFLVERRDVADVSRHDTQSSLLA